VSEVVQDSVTHVEQTTIALQQLDESTRLIGQIINNALKRRR